MNTPLHLLAGVDEVGRGPLAGPVVAAAVIIPPSALAHVQAVIADSKKLTAAKRQKANALIRQYCTWALGQASVEEIDTLNIWGATQLAMRRALAGLPKPPQHVQVDGPHRIGGLTLPQTPIVGGDATSLPIGAASIIAKVERDALMATLAEAFPAYGWAKNAGYGTATHMAALREYGPTPHHRRSFAPVRALLEQTARAA